MCKLNTRLRLLTVSIIFFAVAISTYSSHPVYANGDSNTRTIFEMESEPYSVKVTATPSYPSIGPLHLTVFLNSINQNDLPSEANISLTVNPPIGSGLGPLVYPVSSSSINPELYDVDISLEVEGEWVLDFYIQGTLGDFSFTCPLEVVDRGSSIFAIAIVVAAFPALILSLETWRRWDRRRKRNNQLSDTSAKQSE